MTNAEANAVPASGSDTRNGDTSLFCVIGPTATAAFGRTWKKDKDDAIKHAQKLIRNKLGNGNSGQELKLFVVQVVAVVETPKASLTVRDISSEDTDDLTGE